MAAFVMLGHAGNKMLKLISSTILFYILQTLQNADLQRFVMLEIGRNNQKRWRTWYQANKLFGHQPLHHGKEHAMHNHICTSRITPFILKTKQETFLLDLQIQPESFCNFPVPTTKSVNLSQNSTKMTQQK